LEIAADSALTALPFASEAIDSPTAIVPPASTSKIPKIVIGAYCPFYLRPGG